MEITYYFSLLHKFVIDIMMEEIKRCDTFKGLT